MNRVETVYSISNLIIQIYQSRLWNSRKLGMLDQWDRVKNPTIDPYKYHLLLFDKGVKISSTEERWTFKLIVLEGKKKSKGKKKNNELTLSLIPYTKTNSKGIPNLYIKL